MTTKEKTKAKITKADLMKAEKEREAIADQIIQALDNLHALITEYENQERFIQENSYEQYRGGFTATESAAEVLKIKAAAVEIPSLKVRTSVNDAIAIIERANHGRPDLLPSKAPWIN